MGWADNYIAKLNQGEPVEFRPRGNSMAGRIESGQLVRVVPTSDVEVGDAVLCKVNGRQYLHLVKGIRRNKDGVSYQISNNRGHVNGWTTQIYGVVR